MAANTISVGGTTITYNCISPGGDYSIQVTNSSGVLLGQGYDSPASAALSEVQKRLNRTINSNDSSIQSNNQSISQLQTVINDPNAAIEDKQFAQQQIGMYTQQNMSLQSDIDASNAAINYLNSNGNTDLTALTDQQLQSSQNNPPPIPAADTSASTPPAATGSTNDDSGIAPSNPAGSPPNANTNIPPVAPTDTPALPTDDALLPENPDDDDEDVTTINSNGSDNTPPGRRLQNPLGQYASYDYVLSLYMISPDAYTAFVNSGSKNVNALRDAVTPNDPNLADNQGAFLLAQSGGVNNQTQSRAPYFNFDYFMDNLKITTNVGTKETGASTSQWQITLDIIEQYGFSFFSNMRKAGDIILKQAKQKSTNTKSKVAAPANPSRNHFILGIKFIGYDVNGNILTSNSSFDGGILDPSGAHNDPVDTFEYFTEVTICQMKLILDGKPARYELQLQPINLSVATGAAMGTTIDAQTITASTVEQAINKLMANQTKTHKKQTSKGDRNTPCTYNIRWEPGTEPIRNSIIVSPADLDKTKWPGSNAKTSKDSNAKTSSKAKSNNKARSIAIGNGISLVQAINNIIQQSSYLRDALKVIYDSDIQSNDTKKDYHEQPGGNNPQISWFYVTPQLTNPSWDTKTKSWAYDITYVISKYDTPVSDSIYANKKTGTIYPGPYKRYKYSYTGKNTEVLSFELSFNNSYFQNAVGSVDEKDGSTQNSDGTANNDNDDPTDIPRVPGTQTNQSRTGGKGPALETQNNYLTSLYDQGAYTNGSKLTILGDPDFLMNPGASAPDAVYQKYYQSNNTINYSASQIMIEVDIVEAVDYDDDTGVMGLNESIFFFPIPTELAKATDAQGNPLIQGIPYMLTQVTHTFNGGKFHQELKIQMASNLSQFIGDKDKKKTSGPAPKKKKSTTKNTGTKQDPPHLSTIPGNTIAHQNAQSDIAAGRLGFEPIRGG
jgi:hypothetical protein